MVCVQKADTCKVSKGKSTLNREEFLHFYKLLTRRTEIEEIFIKLVTSALII